MKKKIIFLIIPILLIALVTIIIFIKEKDINKIVNKSYAVNYLYDAIASSGKVNTYTGEHADTVDSSGNAIVGTKAIYYYTTTGYNNVKFGNYCWQVVRTTDTGGIKLVYNGTYSSSSKCNNSGTARQVGTSVFNSSKDNRKYVGYKYKTTNDNDTDSTIKTYIDDLYENYLTNVSQYLEDIVFCNDRTGSTSNRIAETGTEWGADSNYSDFYYHNCDSIFCKYRKLSCDNVKDRFSVNNSKAQLSYPIGLITEPERKLLDSTTASTGQYWWLLSPHSFINNSTAMMSIVGDTGYPHAYYVAYANGVRPSVSLSPNITYTGGTGTDSNPYIAGEIAVEHTYTATFYYQSSTTSGSQTISSKQASCTTLETSCSVNIPNEVTSSVGKYNNSYAGLNTSANTMNTTIRKNENTVTISENTTYFATYSSPITNYYYN